MGLYVCNAIIGLADSSYNKAVTGEDIGKCLSIRDLYNLIS